MRALGIATATVLMLSGALSAGTYLGTVDCVDDQVTPVPPESSFCIPGKTVSTGTDIPPFAITHPIGYDGSNAPIEINICIDSSVLPSGDLLAPTQRTIEIWNALLARTGTCRGCQTIEQGPGPAAPAPFHAVSELLHELGHCALGLGHPNLQFDPPGAPEGRIDTSFTMSYDGSPLGIDAGADGIPGSFDDVQQAGGGMIPESVHWFRKADNDPVIVDGTVIDSTTFSRSVAAMLPAGHGWAANANLLVANALGFPDTQSVMYSFSVRGEQHTSLTADDVNMVKMGMTGQDRMAGTADDYDITLQFVNDCAMADLSVAFLPLGNDSRTGACGARADFSFPQPGPTPLHFSVVKMPNTDRLLVVLNRDLDWDFSVVDVVFADGFESGNFSQWDQVIP